MTRKVQFATDTAPDRVVDTVTGQAAVLPAPAAQLWEGDQRFDMSNSVERVELVRISHRSD